MRILLVCLYLAAIVAANLIVAAYGPAATPWVALGLIALTLTTRDVLHDAWGPRAVRNTAALILAGGALSIAFNVEAARIAAASFLAFVVSETADTLVYVAARRMPWLTRSNASNVVGAVLDSLVFPLVAFGTLAVPLTIAGMTAPLWTWQVAAKVLGGLVFSLAFLALRGSQAREARA